MYWEKSQSNEKYHAFLLLAIKVKAPMLESAWFALALPRAWRGRPCSPFPLPYAYVADSIQ